MQDIDLMISASWVLPIAPQNTVLENYAVAIHRGQIIDVLPKRQAESKYHPQNHHHAPEHILMPGLVNAHTHSPMTLFRGLADDLNLMDWLQNHIWPIEKTLINEKSIEIGTALSVSEMLRTGTTCFNDHYFFPEITAGVVKETGIRACLGFPLIDVPNQWAENGDEGLQKGLQIYKTVEKEERITWSWAPHAPYTLKDDTFKKLTEINKNIHLPIHIHLHESVQEIKDSINQYQERPIQRLKKLGILSPQLIAVHMIQITQDDLQLIQDSGLHVVHCPESNLKLANGIAPIHDMLTAQTNVALGTDSAASNNNLDLIGEMQTAALLAKVQTKQATTLPATQALQMATLNGAKALGLEKKIGSLEKGKNADLITVDLSHYCSQPVYHPISQLAYATHALQVNNAWVNGKQLLSDGKLTSINIESIIEETKKWSIEAKKRLQESPSHSK